MIEFRESDIHGSGGFAVAPIEAGTSIIEYLGEKIDKAEAARRCQINNPYIFFIDETYDLDGGVDWNPARKLNHSCAPNCEAQIDDEKRIWIVAARDIAAGEEVTFNYGYDLENFREHPCRCGAPNCVGYIVAEEFQESIRAQGLGHPPREDEELAG